MSVRLPWSGVKACVSVQSVKEVVFVPSKVEGSEPSQRTDHRPSLT